MPEVKAGCESGVRIRKRPVAELVGDPAAACDFVAGPSLPVLQDAAAPRGVIHRIWIQTKGSIEGPTRFPALALESLRSFAGMAQWIWTWGLLSSDKVVIGTDSSAAKGMTARLGAGRVRHLEAKFMWIQEKVRDKEIEVKKVKTDDNRADMLTKPLDAQRHHRLLSALPLRVPLERREARDAMVAVLVFTLMNYVNAEGAGTPGVSAGDSGDGMFKFFVVINLGLITYMVYRVMTTATRTIEVNHHEPVVPGTPGVSAGVPFPTRDSSPAVVVANAPVAPGTPVVSTGVQTNAVRTHTKYWEWRMQDLRAEALERGLVPVHLKSNMIQQLLEHDLNRGV